MLGESWPITKRILLVLIIVSVFCCSIGARENLLRNGDLEGEDISEFTLVLNEGTYNLSVYTEELSWNRCAKLEIIDYGISNGAKVVNTALLIGGARGNVGQDGSGAIRVKPNTTYEFSFEMKGSINSTGSITVFTWPEIGEGYYNGRELLNTSLAPGRVKVQPDWVQYRGTFTTGPNANTAVLRIPIYCNENDGGLTEKPGTYLLVDSVQISEKASGYNGNEECAFLVSKADPTADFSVPLSPQSFEVLDEISVFASMGEYESLPIIITNLTDSTEAYRVIIYGEEIKGIEQKNLIETYGDVFPGEAITMREAIRVKDSDSPGYGLRFDPLPLMNSGHTITVPPHDSSLVWVTFDCKDVFPGDYFGFLRVIPLSQPAEYKVEYFGPMQDIPLKLTIWPIELPQEPPIPLCLLQRADNANFFEDMFEHHVRYFQVNSWGAASNFNDDGSIKKPVLMPHFHDHINQVKWFPEGSNAKLWVGYSIYDIFEEVYSENRFAFGSETWKNAWVSWLKEIDAALHKHGLSYSDYVVELFDEPDLENNLEKVILVCKVAKEAIPQMQLQLIIGWPSRSPEIYEPLIPYVDNWCFQDCHWNTEENAAYFRDLQKQGKEVWFYTCQTSMRESLYRYYRLHAWKAYARNLDGMVMWTYILGPGGDIGSGTWKIASKGPLVYRSYEEPIPSIRYECLREGLDDIKYLAKLEYLHCFAKKELPAHSLTQEVEVFLNRVPEDVIITNAHDQTFADQVRHKTANFIIELQNLLGEQ